MHTVTEPLLRYVPATFLGAVQAVAAIEVRIAEMQSWPGDFTSEIAAAHAFLMAIRSTFDIHEMTEAEIDAAHEQAVAELDALIPDVPLAFASYQAEGR